MNPFEMVVLIVAIIAVAGVMRARATHRHEAPGTGDPAEADRLRAEVRKLKERMHVLERIVIEGERSGSRALDREIEALREREDGR